MLRKKVIRLTDVFGGGLEGVDSDIRDLIGDLNNNGYRTRVSCSGDCYLTGEIVFQSLRPKYNEEDYERVKEIVESHTDVPFILVRGKWPHIIFRGAVPFGKVIVDPKFADSAFDWDTNREGDILKFIEDSSNWRNQVVDDIPKIPRYPGTELFDWERQDK